jgi:SAM-dependent methyltransferase
LHYLPPDPSGWDEDLTAILQDTIGGEMAVDQCGRNHAIGELHVHVQGTAPVILEVGCLLGDMLRALRREFPDATVLGSDYSAGTLEALGIALPGVPLLRFDLRQCPLPDACVDAVVMLNVLEHIDRDLDALRQIARILKPGGVAILEVPSGPGLFDVYDRKMMHFRRYRMRDLLVLAEGAGLSVARQSHLGFFVYPAFWAVKKRHRWFPPADAESGERIVRGQLGRARASLLLRASLAFEMWLGRWVRYPVGIRCIVTLQKPKSSQG